MNFLKDFTTLLLGTKKDGRPRSFFDAAKELEKQKVKARTKQRLKRR